MDVIGKYRKEIILSGVIVCLYLFLRMSVMARLPIFTDEAIYIRWAQVALHDSSWRFISLTDGKGPFFIWVMLPFLKFIPDPLAAGRMVSVVSGFFTMIGLWILSYELFKDRKIAFLTTILYLFYPFAVVYDRMALYDSMVAAFAVWSLYFSVLLVRKIRLDIAYTLGIIMGAGLLTKSDAWFSAILLPSTLLLFDFKLGSKKRKTEFVKWVVFGLFAVVIAYVMYNMLRLSPLFGIIAVKNATFVYPFGEWIQHPFTYFLGNLYGLTKWLIQYLKPPYIILIFIGLLFRQFWKERLLLLIYFLAPFIALALFGKVIFPRFIFFASLMLLPIAAFGLQRVISVLDVNILKQKSSEYLHYILAILIVVCFVLYSAFISLQFIYTPQNAQIADADKGQYIAEWPAGWGVADSIGFFENISKNQKIYVATEGTFGLMPFSYEMYFYNYPNIQTQGIWPIQNQIPSSLLKKAAQMPTFVVFYQPCSTCSSTGYPPSTWPVKEVFRLQKLNTNMGIYQVE